jgi:MYXO-CTERM domain-containing protein
MWQRVLGAGLVLLGASCSGGGCSSGCSGCGTQPIPGGYPKTQAITNAASVRVTRSGLDFLAQNLPKISAQLAKAQNGILGIDVPNINPARSKIADLGILGDLYIDPEVCPGGPDPNANPPKCHAAINLAASSFRLDAVTPNALRVGATIPLKLDDTPISATLSWDPPIGGNVNVSATIHVGYGNGGCDGNGRPQVTAHALPVGVTIPIVNETIAPRDGYSKIDLDGAQVDLSGLSANDVQVCVSCGGGLITQVCNAVVNSSFVKNLILDPLRSQLDSQVKNLLADQLCTAPQKNLNPPCPTGSKPNQGNDKCVYDSNPNKCVPIMLGFDGHMDLSGALKSISPGSEGAIDFVLAAAGDMQPFPKAAADNAGYPGHTPNGATLGMMGGVLQAPQSQCVAKFDNPVPQGIPIPDELTQNTLAPWPQGQPQPHMGIALAGRFLNFAMGSVYNSGMLCLGVTTEQVTQLNSGLLSVLIPSIKALTFEQKGASVALSTRPGAPPTIKLGGGTDLKTDPLLLVDLPRFSVDFYIWTYDRYARAFTFTGDLKLPVNLSTAKTAKNPNGGLQPTLGDLTIANGRVDNADLLTDDPALIATALSSILGGITGQFLGGGFNPIDISGALKSVGLGLTVPDGGIRKLTKGTDDFLAIFAGLSVAPANALLEVDTEARLVDKIVHPEAMALTTATRDKLPELRVRAGSPQDDGTRALEFSWQLDEGARSAWTRERDLVVKNDYLLFQGKHQLKVYARVVGQPDSEDTTPAIVPYVIDTLPPFVRVTRTGASAKVEAWDVVSSDAALAGRFRAIAKDGTLSPWSEWKPLADLRELPTEGAMTIDVEVKDEEGNVGRVSQPLIRGRADDSLSSGGSGCNCSSPGARPVSALFALPALAGLAGLALRRRRRGSGGGLNGEAGRRGAVKVGPRPVRTKGSLAVLGLGSILVVSATSQGCACGSDDGGISRTMCGSDCNQPCQAPLEVGLAGAYTSVAKAKDGTLWVAGYNDAILAGGTNSLYGDLVVGKYDSGLQKVMWQTVDGIPVRSDGTCPDNDPRGHRKGEVDAGDNVGLWTSMALGPGDAPLVTYYDATNMRLKFASFDGNAWSVHVVSERKGADIGRYAKMIVVDGKPVVAHLLMEPGNGGKLRSKVVLAKATKDVPKETVDWQLEDISVDENGPCRPQLCPNRQVCVKDTGACTDTVGGCTPADCGKGNACVTLNNKATCTETLEPLESYPNAVGDYIAVANGPNGVGVAAYDRVRGNLLGIRKEGGAWKTLILDGETGDRAAKTAVDTGDVGVAASLQIAGNGDWHLSYVNGISESLQYLFVGGGTPGKPETVDDGLGVDGGRFPDGRHIVGDDSYVREDGGTITIAYQDATAGKLRVAVGTGAPGGHRWSVKVVDQPGRFAGFFPRFVPGENRIANFWRAADKITKDITGDVSIVGF